MSVQLTPDNHIKNIALVGNPNVGKSVIFNQLTGMYNDVSNYPGTTVDTKCGRWGSYIISDTPGIYGLSGFTEEERIARDIILRSDLVISVVDAVHLERDLFLTQQLIDAKIPVIVALNMMDEAKRQGVYIKRELLEKKLGVPVIPTVAVSGDGLTELQKAVRQARLGNITPGIEELVNYNEYTPREALLIAEGDRDIAKRNNCGAENKRDEIYRLRREHVNNLVAATVREITVEASWGTKIGRWMLKPITGIPLLLITLFLIYLLVGVFVAQTVVDFTEGVIMEQYYQPMVRQLLGIFVDEGTALWTILAGQFGILTMAITYLFGLLLPLVVGFQFVLSILEDCGYLPRIGALLDRVLMSLGLNGQGVIPLILGFGCVTMATMSTRMLRSDRERLIAIFLLAFTVPCSAQMAIITSMLAGLGFFYMLAYGLILLTALVAAGTVLARFLPGHSTALWLDLPPLRLPRMSNVLQKTWYKSTDFIREATPLFIIGSLILGVLEVTGMLLAIENMLVPLTVSLLGLPKEVAGGFIMGLIRREFGTAGMFTIPMDPLQKFVALTTITFFVPCIATAMIIIKERGWKQGAAIWLTIFALAFVIGGIVAQLIKVLSLIEGVAVMPIMAGIAVLVLVIIMWYNWQKEEYLKI